MNLYIAEFNGYFESGDFGGMIDSLYLQKGITLSSFDLKTGLCFCKGRGAFLADNDTVIDTKKPINCATLSKRNPESFPTMHIAREHAKKVLHICEDTKKQKSAILLFIISGDNYLTYDRVLQILHIKEDQIINYESGFIGDGQTTSTEKYVFSIMCIIPPGHGTELICNNEAIYNKDGVLKKT